MIETPAYQLYHDLDLATEAALRASIKRFGVLVPVFVDQNGTIIDGHQRARIAAELGVEYRTEQLAVADEEEGRELARSLNEDRRAMPKSQRLPVVAALREEGHSQRAIAGAVGVALSTVQEDLKKAGDRSRSPAQVTGLDGKSYPAAKKDKRRLLKPDAFMNAVLAGVSAWALEYPRINLERYEPTAQQLRTLTAGIQMLGRIRRQLRNQLSTGENPSDCEPVENDEAAS